MTSEEREVMQAEQQAKDEVIDKRAAEIITEKAAWPDRLKKVSKSFEISGTSVEIFVLRDSETGKEFVVGRDAGDSISIEQIITDEPR